MCEPLDSYKGVKNKSNDTIRDPVRLFWDPVLIYWRVNAGGCVGITAVGQPPTLQRFSGLSESCRMQAALKGRQKKITVGR